jgi:hypothetical protein
MVPRPAGMSAFEFSVLSALRAVQLARGCTPRVPAGNTIPVTAQLEVAGGWVKRSRSQTEIDAAHPDAV